MDRVLKYQQIESHMLEELSSGKFAPGARFFAENDIAGQFQVTAVTARKAFAALEQAGYIERKRGLGTFVLKLPLRPRRIRLMKRCVIGVVIGDLGVDNSFKTGRMLFALYRAVEQAGYLALLIGEDFSPLSDAGVSGVVLLDQLPPAKLQELLAYSIPVVGIYPQNGRVPSLKFDIPAAARQVAECFLARGSRSMLLAGHGDDAQQVCRMFEAPLRALAAGTPLRVRTLLAEQDFAKRLTQMFQAPDAPDAIFALNSWCMGEIAAVLNKLHYPIGKAVSVLVHGSNALLIPGPPAYSVMDFSPEEAARKVINLLLDLIREPAAKVPDTLLGYAPVLDRGSLTPPVAGAGKTNPFILPGNSGSGVPPTHKVKKNEY